MCMAYCQNALRKARHRCSAFLYGASRICAGSVLVQVPCFENVNLSMVCLIDLSVLFTGCRIGCDDSPVLLGQKGRHNRCNVSVTPRPYRAVQAPVCLDRCAKRGCIRDSRSPDRQPGNIRYHLTPGWAVCPTSNDADAVKRHPPAVKNFDSPAEIKGNAFNDGA